MRDGSTWIFVQGPPSTPLDPGAAFGLVSSCRRRGRAGADASAL